MFWPARPYQLNLLTLAIDHSQLDDCLRWILSGKIVFPNVGPTTDTTPPPPAHILCRVLGLASVLSCRPVECPHGLWIPRKSNRFFPRSTAPSLRGARLSSIHLDRINMKPVCWAQIPIHMLQTLNILTWLLYHCSIADNRMDVGPSESFGTIYMRTRVHENEHGLMIWMFQSFNFRY